MAILKCKMCGGTLEISDNQTVAVCEYCGTQQTISKNADENIQNLFNRANNLRIRAEFDKAQEIYEKIIGSDSTDAEAYWGIVLCKYGVEYVEDPATFKRIPTCHRTQIESVLCDIDYVSAVEYADSEQKIIYEREAKEIDCLQKDILKIASDEEPFDIFICYKETDENGKRTTDSVIANDIYYQLIQEGFKVFYAAITLEDKLGQEYEPYIFSALNSAKVMLVIGSKPEYFNAVWVKNEWSRYLKIVKGDRTKLLIPCYKDMDAYDLPEEFSHLQAQDMSKIGFINDVIRGLKKVIHKEEPTPSLRANETVPQSYAQKSGPKQPPVLQPQVNRRKIRINAAIVDDVLNTYKKIKPRISTFVFTIIFYIATALCIPDYASDAPVIVLFLLFSPVLAIQMLIEHNKIKKYLPQTLQYLPGVYPAEEKRVKNNLNECITEIESSVLSVSFVLIFSIVMVVSLIAGLEVLKWIISVLAVLPLLIMLSSVIKCFVVLKKYFDEYKSFSDY